MAASSGARGERWTHVSGINPGKGLTHLQVAVKLRVQVLINDRMLPIGIKLSV